MCCEGLGVASKGRRGGLSTIFHFCSLRKTSSSSAIRITSSNYACFLGDDSEGKIRGIL